MPQARDLLRAARARLEQPREATLLLAELLGKSEAQVRARPEAVVPEADANKFAELLERRAAGEPFAYIVGHREFYGRDFLVDRRVLIPRPETEHLIEAAMALDLPEQPVIVDVGTGTGIIALTLAAEIPAARVVAIDLSLAALQVARANRRKLGLEGRVALAQSDRLAGVDRQAIDLLVANPPYVAEDAEIAADVREFEPHLALFAKNDGRALLEGLLDDCEGLRSGTRAIFEIGYDQGEWIKAEIERRPLALLELIHDYAGHPRTVVLRRR